MELTLIIGIIAFIVIGAILITILRSVIKVIGIMIILLVVFIIVAGLVVYFDYSSISSNLMSSKKLFLFEDEKSIYTGMEVTSLDEKGISLITDARFLQLQESYAKNDLAQISEGYYKVFIFDKSFFDPDKKVIINKVTFTNRELATIIKSNDPFAQVATIISAKEGIPHNNTSQIFYGKFKSGQELKGYVFGAMIDAEPVFSFVSGIKDKKVQIYPETAVFKAARLLPFNFLRENLIGEQQEN